ncbi:unnamed protein product [Rhizopus stolonifer]
MQMLVQFTGSFDGLDTQYQSNIVSTIVWTQTLETITFKINNNENHIQFSDSCFHLFKSTETISLPLFDKVRIDKCNINQTNNTMTFTKTSLSFWPHLFSQHQDHEIVNLLKNSNFFVEIEQEASFDILDFDLVISGQGQKTGLE